MSQSRLTEFVSKNVAIQLSPIIILGSRSGEGWVGLKKSLLDLTVVWLVFMFGTLGTLKWIISHGDLVSRAGNFRDCFDWNISCSHDELSALKEDPLRFQEAMLY